MYLCIQQVPYPACNGVPDAVLLKPRTRLSQRCSTQATWRAACIDGVWLSTVEGPMVAQGQPCMVRQLMEDRVTRWDYMVLVWGKLGSAIATDGR